MTFTDFAESAGPEFAERYELVAVDKFHIDPHVQRQRDPAWVRKLAREFDRTKVGVLTASLRPGPSEKLVILDGQHRILAAREIGLGKLGVHCRIIDGWQTPDGVQPLTREEEAALFLVLNESRAVKPYDKFNAKLTMRDPAALDIMGLLKKFEWERVGSARKRGVFTVIKVAETLYGSSRDSLNTSRGDGRDALRDTLQTIAVAWGAGLGAPPGPIVAGIGAAFLWNYQTQRVAERDNRSPAVIDAVKLGEALMLEYPDPAVLVARAKAISSLRKRRGLTDAIAEVVTQAAASTCRGRTPRPMWKVG